MDKRLSKTLAPAYPLKAHLESMSDRTRALLEYYFDNDCRAYFTHIAEPDEPDIVIVDYDHPGSRASVASGQWRTNRPLLLLSFSETSVPGAVIVRKPFDKHQLQKAALRLLEETAPAKTAPPEFDRIEADRIDAAALNSISTGADNNSEVESDSHTEKATTGVKTSNGGTDTRDETRSKPKPDPDPDTIAKLARMETKVALLCGSPKSIADLESSDDKIHRFSAASHLSGHIERALQQCGHDGVIAVQVTLPAMDIYVLHWLQKVLTTASLKSAKNVDRAFRAFEASEVKMTAYRSSTVNELVKRVNGTGKFSFSTEAFLWLSALFSARGRLPDDVQLDQQWHMVQWPNLTRLEPVPQCVETASAWSKGPASIRQIIARTGHQPRHVTSFFNGARALKLMEPVQQEQETTDAISSETVATDGTMPDKEQIERG